MPLRELLERLGVLPTTPHLRIALALALVYDGLITIKEKPQREQFHKVAAQRGWTDAQFDAWAKDRKWWNDKGEEVPST